MKKWIAAILVMCMALTMAACGSDKPQESTPPKQTEQAGSSNAQQENDLPQQTQPAVQDWGVECVLHTKGDNGLMSVYVNYPSTSGLDRATGLFAQQPDKTIVVFDATSEGLSPEVGSIEELFPAYGDQLMGIFEDTYSYDYADNSIEVEPYGTEKIGSYDVTKFRGIHHYTEQGYELNCQFVVYAVELKAGGAYAYAMVQDYSADQSQMELIESHAYNMIRSLRED